MKFTLDKEQFATVMSIASQLDDETPVIIEENLLKVAMMDRTHVAMFIAEFPIADLEDYEPTRFVLNSGLIVKKLASAKKGKVKCEFKDNQFILRQRATIAKMDIGQEHRVTVFVGDGLDEEDLAVPNSVLKESTAYIKMPNAKTLKDILSNVETEEFTLEASKNRFVIKSGGLGEGFDSEFIIETPEDEEMSEDDFSVSIKGDEQPTATYTAKLVKDVVKQFLSDSNLSIKFATDRPMMISSMAEESSMDFLMAPCIGI